MAPASFVDGAVMGEHECEVHEETPFLQEGDAAVTGPSREREEDGRVHPFRASAKAVLLAVAMLAFVALGVVLRDVRDEGMARRRGEFLGFDTRGTIERESNNGTRSEGGADAGEEDDDAAADIGRCPRGFVPTHLDMQNLDADMHNETLSLKHCSKKCKEDDECKGFEFNPDANHCWISRNGHHCSEKQYNHWSSCAKGAMDPCGCPEGYVKTRLDMQNHDADMHEETLSLKHCSKKCEEDDDCKGFEFNPDANHCWISRNGHHCTDKQHRHWTTCAKGKTDVCSEASSKERDLQQGASNTTADETDDDVDDGDDDADDVADAGDGDAATDDSGGCPSGYVKTHLDMQNHDADMEEDTLSLEECGKKCKEDRECKGFEFNPPASHCWISRKGHHCTREQHPHWTSCVKGAVDNCDDERASVEK